MNHISRRNKLDKQISSYADFIKSATRSQIIKLSKEITNLSNRISEIDSMPYLKQIEPIEDYLDEKPSKLNTQTIETKTDMSNKKRNPPEKCKPIFGEAAESRRKALELASQHKDIKPIRYILKH